MSDEWLLQAFIESYVVRASVLVTGWSGRAVADRFATATTAARVVHWASEGTPEVLRPSLHVRTGPILEVTQDSGDFDVVYASEVFPYETLVRRYPDATFVFAADAIGLAPADAERYVVRDGRIVFAADDELPSIVVKPAQRATRLHLACGPHVLRGWVNVDNQAYVGINRLLDLRYGLPFRDVGLIYAEHFIEHIEYRDAEALLRECRRALSPDGIIRLSTPNLDWVWAFAYHPGMWETPEQEIRDCLVANRSFRAWGHRFLYNRAMLRELLQRAGFADVTFCRYRESEHEALRGIEGHTPYPDTPEIPHVLIAEASGIREITTTPEIDREIAEYQRDLAVV